MSTDKMPQMGEHVEIGLAPVKKKEKTCDVTFHFFARPPHTAYLVKESELTVRLTIEKEN